MGHIARNHKFHTDNTAPHHQTHSHPHTGVDKSYGGHSGRETPGPIPNPEAKPASADDTTQPGWKSRTPPNTIYRSAPREIGGRFSFSIEKRQIRRLTAFLQCQQCALAFNSAAISGQSTGGTDYPMARDDDADGISPICQSHRTGRARRTDLFGNLTV